jgi:hypothetical protein
MSIPAAHHLPDIHHANLQRSPPSMMLMSLPSRLTNPKHKFPLSAAEDVQPSQKCTHFCDLMDEENSYTNEDCFERVPGGLGRVVWLRGGGSKSQSERAEPSSDLWRFLTPISATRLRQARGT